LKKYTKLVLRIFSEKKLLWLDDLKFEKQKTKGRKKYENEKKRKQKIPQRGGGAS
jgi:hypothetical protein